MSWTVDDYLDIQENDLEWFESNPDRILRRRTAFPLEREALDEHLSEAPHLKPLDSSEKAWALVLRDSQFTRLYYIDPEDFYDYGEPAVNDDFTLMMMWDELQRKGAIAAQLLFSDTDLRLCPQRGRFTEEHLQRYKASMMAYRKHQRKTLTLQ